MAKISMLVPDEALAEIDESSNGNRTAFMIAAALERARKIRRKRVDDEIAESCARNAESDLEVFRDWECTIGDGLE
jgi:hypothetical protein